MPAATLANTARTATPAHSPGLADLRAFITPLRPILNFVQTLPWWMARRASDFLGGMHPHLPGAPHPAETELTILSDDGETKLAARIYEPAQLAGGKRSPLLLFIHGEKSQRPGCRSISF